MWQTARGSTSETDCMRRMGGDGRISGRPLPDVKVGAKPIGQMSDEARCYVREPTGTVP